VGISKKSHEGWQGQKEPVGDYSAILALCQLFLHRLLTSGKKLYY
jgi:hypothetical protein